jgi:uncharacterized protein (TIGR03435 family)
MSYSLARLFLLAANFTLSWAQNAAPPSFDVAIVKVNKSGEPFAERSILPTGQVSLENNTMKNLVMEAWGLRSDQVLGGPAWLDADRFDVTSRTAPGTPEASIHAMLQSLLKERFNLAAHDEQRVLPVYALVIGKGKPQLTPTVGSPRTFCNGLPGAPGQMHRLCKNMTMAALANTWFYKMASFDFDLPILDFTGLAGAYDFKLDWTPSRPGIMPVLDPNGPTIFDAVRELGLNLERRKLPSRVIVVDHVDRTPAAN